MPKLKSVKKESRSVSPECPKPDESEEPLGTAMETQTALANGDAVKSEATEVIITERMKKEEEKLKEENERKEKEFTDQARQQLDNQSHEARFKKLQHLLDKSNIYSKFLLTKMEQQQQEEKVKKERLMKKAMKSPDGKAADNDDKKKKRKRPNDNYNISDVMSKEEILSKAKKSKTDVTEVKEEDTASRSVNVDDIENMTDSNTEIKDRLAETMRDNATLLMDPDRKVNGQPVHLQQPTLFTGGLMRSYQIEGIEWLRMLWENGINGILADEMGLGKTIQCIAHIAMMIEKTVKGPFLVVAPLSTVPNWVSEFRRFTPEVSVVLYHGTQAERAKIFKQFRKPQGSLSMYPVVITSFEIAMIDRKILQRLSWRYLIVDEGHRLKNMNCRLVRELKLLPTDNKLLLTGTPLQNNLAELWSLLNFLLPDVFDDLKSFESWFDIDSIRADAENVVANEREQNVLSMLHQILTPFLLRRLKSDVTLEVPPKKEIIVYAPLTTKQATFYKAVVNNTIGKLLGQEKDETPVEVNSIGRASRPRRAVNYTEPEENDKTWSQYLEAVEKEEEERSNKEVAQVLAPLDAVVNLKMRNILVVLKKCCNHPYLLEYPLDLATQEFKIDEELVTSSGKFLILDRLLPALKERGHKVLIFSQMTTILDLLMDYCYLRDYQYSRLDGSMSYIDRETNMAKFAADPEVFLFLLSTRAGGLGINLTSADTVIIFDSDWNPQADLQAQDRCHRIGQTKPVLVYRLVTANTIDQTILERASAKRKLEKMIIHKNKFKGARTELNQPAKSCIDLDELMEMLKNRNSAKEMRSIKGKVISDEDLESLLDRTDLMDKEKRSCKLEKGGVFRVIEASESSDILT